MYLICFLKKPKKRWLLENHFEIIQRDTFLSDLLALCTNFRYVFSELAEKWKTNLVYGV